MPTHPRRLLAVVAVVAGVVLSSCRVDVDVVVQIGADGSGEVAVTATADADVVQQAPGLAEDLRFDDAVASGWAVEGPTATEEGGLTVTLRHAVTSAEEASNLLASLGPPFVDVTLQRAVASADPDEVTVTLTGRLQLTGGFEAFADSELITSAGGLPFADELAASGATPAGSMSVQLRAELPGEVQETTGEAAAGGLQWEAPLDGTSVDLATTTQQRPASGGSWAGPLSWLALAALVGWIALAVAVIVYVARARRQRDRRRTRTAR